MKVSHWLWLIMLSPAVLAGCKDGATGTPKASEGTAGKEYEIKGKVIEVAPDKESVTLDHEEIPGLMKAMKMKYRADKPKLLEGINPGDQVVGRLKAQSGDYVITRLEKR